MTTLSAIDVAAHLDRIRRMSAPLRTDVMVHDCANGWVAARPGAVVGDVPSASKDRIFWLSLSRAPTGADIDEAVAVFRRWNRPGGYAWLAPWMWNESLEQELAARGFTLWPHVQYVALARPALPEIAGELTERGHEFEVRRLAGAEANAAIDAMAPWYSEDGAVGAKLICQVEKAEAWVAFSKGTPAALSLLTMDGAFGHLWATGTDPAFRGRGAQAAMIRARVRRARELGGSWCTVETSTAVPISLRNLGRFGFGVAITWRVYQWSGTG